MTIHDVLKRWHHTTLLELEQMIDVVHIFESQIDGTKVIWVRGNPFQLQVVWDLFQEASELSHVRAHIEALKGSSMCCWRGASELEYAKLLVPFDISKLEDIQRKATIQLTSECVVLLMCDFKIVQRLVKHANALYCRRWLSENGLNLLLNACTLDDEISKTWAGYMSEPTCKDMRQYRAMRIVLMMLTLRAQHYCVFSYQ